RSLLFATVSCRVPRGLHSFPTRRSSDLQWWGGVNGGTVTGTLRVRGPAVTGSFVLEDVSVADVGLVATGVDGTAELDYPVITARSEEHTSELQSRENLVCRLLLEKKKKI